MSGAVDGSTFRGRLESYGRGLIFEDTMRVGVSIDLVGSLCLFEPLVPVGHQLLFGKIPEVEIFLAQTARRCITTACPLLKMARNRPALNPRVNSW